MGNLVFPQLPGLSWPVDRGVGNFDTTTQVAMSGKEARFANRTQARYKLGLAFDGLDSSGVNAGLLAYSKQTLEGFFNQTLGGALAFNFWDADDNSAAAQQFGTGDGVTTAFQLARAQGGWADFVFAPLVPSAPTLIPSAANPNLASANVYAPNNLLLNSAALSTQSVSLPAGQYVLSIYGTGSVVLSGAATGTLNGTGAGNRVSLPFTSTGGSVTVTVSGSVTSAQIERSTLTTPGPYFKTLGTAYYGGPWITVGGSLVDPSTYSISNGLVTFNSAPAGSSALAWAGNFYWVVNFDDDTLALSKFMGGLWEAKKIAMTTRVF